MTARIASLHCYPLKSARGIELDQAALSIAGFENDRSWMVTAPNGRFLTQRELPQLALIQTRLTADALILEAPSMPALGIPPLIGDGGTAFDQQVDPGEKELPADQGCFCWCAFLLQ